MLLYLNNDKNMTQYQGAIKGVKAQFKQQRRKMNLLSKPYKITFQLFGTYLSQLYMNPVRTKSVTNCLLSGLGNYVAQQVSGVKFINQDALLAFAMFGLLFGGSVPHYFNEMLSNFFHKNSNSSLLQLLLIKRLFFTPVYLFFSMYMLSRLEGKDHSTSFHIALVKFPSAFRYNLKYLTLLQFLNTFFVPSVLRDFLDNLIGFFWIIYLSNKLQIKK